MIQIQLKIEEFFENNKYDKRKKVMVDVNEFNRLSDAVAEILKTGIDVYLGSIWGVNCLKPNESRETIIQALWEIQKSLLPEGGVSANEFSKEYTKSIFGKDEPIKFYDPETRIITITKFD